MARDDFTESTKRTLGEAVGYNCVRPGCAKPTTALNPETNKIAKISIAAHDSAASPGGPRFDEGLTEEQRRALKNGAWLCANCARLVDAIPESFPVGIISDWQQNAQQHRAYMLYDSSHNGANYRSACHAAQKFLDLCSSIYFDLYYNSIDKKVIVQIQHLLSVSGPLIGGSELNAEYPHIVNKQRSLLESLRRILKEVRSSNRWYYNSDWERYEIYGWDAASNQKNHDALKLDIDEYNKFRKEIQEFITKGIPSDILKYW